MTRRDVQHPPRVQKLKVDTKALIVAAGGGKDIVEQKYTRISVASQFSDYGSRNTDAFMPVDVVADLEALTKGTSGYPLVTRRLAAMAGCSLVSLPDASDQGRNWMQKIGTLAADHGKLAEKLSEAAADSVVTSDEVERLGLISLCDDAILHLVNLRARFERIVEEGR